MGDSPAKRLTLITRVAGARWAKGAKRILPIVSWLGEVPPCRMLKFTTKACGGILPNHCYKPFLFVFGLTI
jgi:hypothetical protein